MNKGPTVFIVDDDESVLRSLARLIRVNGHEVATFRSALDFLQAYHGDSGCLVLDVKMPNLSGMELQKHLSKADVNIPIIFITGYGDVPTSVRAMKAGAVDFLIKPFTGHDFLKAVRQALHKDQQARADRAEKTQIKTRLDTLTAREHEVLLLVVSGLLNKQVAATLGTSEKTIKVHRSRVMKKMRVQSLADLVRLTEKAGLAIPVSATGDDRFPARFQPEMNSMPPTNPSHNPSGFSPNPC
jgi:FixJ family two-component response regulator